MLWRSKMSFVTRFAPSPTGYLHLGHAFSALSAFDAARAAGGRFLLRIEDIDQGRARPEFEAAIYGDLAWLGVEWEMPVRRQSEHMDEYKQVLDGLIERGLLYRDFRTRREITEAIASAPHGASDDVFRGEALPPDEEAKRLAAGEAFAWRLSLRKARAALGPAYFALVFEDETGTVRADPEKHGDVVLARKDFPASYHLASVWDDALQGVTHVIRGEDCAKRRTCTCCCRNCWGCRSPCTTTTRLSLAMTASVSPSVIPRRHCVRCVKAAKRARIFARCSG